MGILTRYMWNHYTDCGFWNRWIRLSCYNNRVSNTYMYHLFYNSLVHVFFSGSFRSIYNEV